MRLRIASNEEVVHNVDSGEGVGRGRGLVVVSCYKRSNPTLRLGILDKQGFGSEKCGLVRKDSLSLLLATLILTTYQAVRTASLKDLTLRMKSVLTMRMSERKEVILNGSTSGLN